VNAGDCSPPGRSTVQSESDVGLLRPGAPRASTQQTRCSVRSTASSEKSALGAKDRVMPEAARLRRSSTGKELQVDFGDDEMAW
jgi:hypothetical protein